MPEESEPRKFTVGWKINFSILLVALLAWGSIIFYIVRQRFPGRWYDGFSAGQLFVLALLLIPGAVALRMMFRIPPQEEKILPSRSSILKGALIWTFLVLSVAAALQIFVLPHMHFLPATVPPYRPAGANI